MKFTLNWLKTYLETEAKTEAVLEALTAIGLEVEGVSDHALALAAITVARILEAKPHPNADRLQLCRVDIGGQVVEVVCGAANARAGLKVAFAPIGTTVPGSGLVLKKTVIRGIASNGMLCSAHELGVSNESEGILEVAADAPVGARIAETLGLDDPVIEIAVTPNRGDALSVYGIARDLAAYGLGRLKPLDLTPVAGSYPSPVSVTISPDALTACPYFVGRWIKGLRNGPSPDWLRHRLEAVGLRPVSALVDITNFLTLDLNRPLHVFDGRRLRGALSVRFGAPQETLHALNGRSYSLDGGMVAICDDSGVLSLGGIMGGSASGVSQATTEIFLEAALFDPQITARTGRALGVHSDARFRFERGVDPDFVLSGIEIATRMILDLCGGQASDVTQAGSPPHWRRTIRFRPQRCLALGGVDLPAERSLSILRALGCTVSQQAVNEKEGAVEVMPPSWRADLEGEADLVEEVLRLHGYHHIPETPLARLSALSAQAVTPQQRRTMLLRRFLAARGLNEAVTWSFMSKASAQRFGGGQSHLTLVNPISSDQDQMRPTPLPNLIAAAGRNLARGLCDFGLCEVGPAYEDDRVNGQKTVACGVRVGAAMARHWRSPGRMVDAFDAKADLLAALAFLGIPGDGVQIQSKAPDWYHPGQSGTLTQGPRLVLGYFGALHPDVAKAFELAVPAVGFELFLDAVPVPKQKGRARPRLTLSPFQPLSRDFAFLVTQETKAQTLLKAAREADKTLIKHVSLFDLYEGEGTPPGYKSVAIAVTMQPVEPMTLEEIDLVSAAIVKAVVEATGGRLRG